MAPTLRVKPADPLILNRWLDIAYALLWAVYAIWGWTTLLVGLPTITVNTPEWYSTVWAGSVGGLATIACFACVSLFLQGHHRRALSPVTKKKIERSAVIALDAFILVYPLLLFAQASDGDDGRVAAAALSLSYLIFPIYRVYVLNSRIKAYELSLQKSTQELLDGR